MNESNNIHIGIIIVIIIIIIITPGSPTNIVDFIWFYSSIVLIVWRGTLMSIGDFPESLSQAMLVGVMLVGGFGILLLLLLNPTTLNNLNNLKPRRCCASSGHNIT